MTLYSRLLCRIVLDSTMLWDRIGVCDWSKFSVQNWQVLQEMLYATVVSNNLCSSYGKLLRCLCYIALCFSPSFYACLSICPGRIATLLSLSLFSCVLISQATCPVFFLEGMEVSLFRVKFMLLWMLQKSLMCSHKASRGGAPCNIRSSSEKLEKLC